MKPNIFEFATTELSQDAFLCWLVSWIEIQEDEMHSMSKDFIALLYNKYHSTILKDNTRIASKDILGFVKTNVDGNEKRILRQYFKIDIYFRIIIKNEIVSFIIEDKTHTSHHTDQLKRYNKNIRDDRIEEKEIIKIYFKTGYPINKDYQVTKDNYYPLFYEEWWQFLEKHNRIKNPFFVAYREYFYNNYIKLFKSNLTLMNNNDGYETFQYGFTQYEFIKQLVDQIKVNDNGWIESGSSYGRPWNQYNFILLDNIYGSMSEYIFYRLDWKKPPRKGKSGYYLSLRQYANIDKNNDQHKTLKIDRLNKYRQLFNSVLETVNDKLDFETKILNRGIKESEIACLHFDPVINTLKNIEKYLGVYHNTFMEKVTDIIL